MAILFRAYFATAYGGTVRRTSYGLPVNAVHGFVRYFMDAVRKFPADACRLLFGYRQRQFRTEEFSLYKANRPDAPDDLIPQFDLVKEVVASFGVPNIGAPDSSRHCIGTLAKLHRKEHEAFVLTGDHDRLQLVDERVPVVIMKKGHGNYMVYTPGTRYGRARPHSGADHRTVKGLMAMPATTIPA